MKYPNVFLHLDLSLNNINFYTVNEKYDEALDGIKFED